MTVQKQVQVAATVALGSNWLAAAASPSVACSADGGPRMLVVTTPWRFMGGKRPV